MSNEQKMQEAHNALCVHLQTTGVNLRPLIEKVDPMYKDGLISAFEMLDEMSLCIHQKREFNFDQSNERNAQVEELNEQIAAFKIEVKELKDRNAEIVQQNLELASGRDLVDTLKSMDTRLAEIIQTLNPKQ